MRRSQRLAEQLCDAPARPARRRLRTAAATSNGSFFRGWTRLWRVTAGARLNVSSAQTPVFKFYLHNVASGARCYATFRILANFWAFVPKWFFDSPPNIIRLL